MEKYINSLLDVNFIKNYKYVSKEQYINFLKQHIYEILCNISKTSQTISREIEIGSIQNKRILDILVNKIGLYNDVLVKQFSDERLNHIIYELIKEKVLIQNIDKIIFLEEIDYIGIDNVYEKLKLVYYYILEVEIYNFFNILKCDWFDSKQKEYVKRKVEYSSLKQKEIKNTIISNIDTKNSYNYNLQMGILASFPIKDIKNTYTDSILVDIYKRKYLLTLDTKMKKCADNKVLKAENKNITKKHEQFLKEVLNKYKNMLHKKDICIEKLKKENLELQRDNKRKEETIMNYNNYINEYNNLSFMKKIKKVLKKEKIKLLN